MHRRWFLLALFLLLGMRAHGRSALEISEFLARNITGLTDSKFAYSDWIEIHNTTPDPVQLDGWHLTDTATNLTRWRFPSQVLEGNGFLVVFASGKDAVLAGPQLHTNFRLSSKGGYLALVEPDGLTKASEFIAYPPQHADVSFGPSEDPSGPGLFFAPPTPRYANGPGWPSRAGDVSFSSGGGLFLNAFALSLTPPLTGGEIRYTLDGTVPNENSLLYSQSIWVDRTLRIRARFFQAGQLPGPVSGVSFTLVGATAKPRTSNLPILILDTFGSQITTDTRTKGYLTVLRPSEGRTTLPGLMDLSTRATFEVRGSSSSGFPKQSFGMELRHEDESDRSASFLDLPAESDWVLYAPYPDKTLIRDILAYELSNQIGRYAPRTRLVELYVNRSGALEAADYQGVYVVVEKIKGGKDRVDIAELTSTDYTAPAITGGFILKKDRLDSTDAGFNTVRGQNLGIEWPRARDLGTTQINYIRNHLNQFENALYGVQFRNPVTGYRAYIDSDAFIDHWWMVETAKNIDGFRLSTFLYKDRGGKLSMGPIWDYNLSMGNANYLDGWLSTGWYWPMLGTTDYPWYARLFQDPDFTQRHTDRWKTLRTGALSTTNVIHLINTLTNQVGEAQLRNFQKWPVLGQYLWPNWFIGTTYEEEIGFLKTWMEGRLTWIDSTILPWPAIQPEAGYYPNGATVTIQSTLPVYYTTDGSDPRASGGSVAPSATLYKGPIQLTQSARVVARVRSGTRWSPPTATSLAITIPPLKISEVMYHAPEDPASSYAADDFEYVELRNVGDQPILLAGVTLSEGIQFRFPDTANPILPNENVVVVANRKAFVTRYGDGIRIAGEYSGKLDNSGERLVLTGGWGEPVEDFTYSDAWEPGTDGMGYSLTRVFPSGSWKASSLFQGTPGRNDVPLVPLTLKPFEQVQTEGTRLWRFVIPVTAGQSYTLQSTTDLTSGSWSTMESILPQAESGLREVNLPEDPTSSRVFRVVSPRVE